MRKSFVKILAVLCFTALITGFVAYKSGFFGEQDPSVIQQSPNGSVLNTANSESSVDSLLLSGYKRDTMIQGDSLMITFIYDTVEFFRMSSSKSMLVFESEEIENDRPMFIYLDTLPYQPKNSK